jgi:hypothetical protein
MPVNAVCELGYSESCREYAASCLGNAHTRAGGGVIGRAGNRAGNLWASRQWCQRDSFVVFSGGKPVFLLHFVKIGRPAIGMHLWTSGVLTIIKYLDSGLASQDPPKETHRDEYNKFSDAGDTCIPAVR